MQPYDIHLLWNCTAPKGLKAGLQPAIVVPVIGSSAKLIGWFKSQVLTLTARVLILENYVLHGKLRYQSVVLNARHWEPCSKCVSSRFIHSGYFYSASSSPLLLRGAPDTARIL